METRVWTTRHGCLIGAIWLRCEDTSWLTTSPISGTKRLFLKNVTYGNLITFFGTISRQKYKRTLCLSGFIWLGLVHKYAYIEWFLLRVKEPYIFVEPWRTSLAFLNQETDESQMNLCGKHEKNASIFMAADRRWKNSSAGGETLRTGNNRTRTKKQWSWEGDLLPAKWVAHVFTSHFFSMYLRLLQTNA